MPVSFQLEQGNMGVQFSNVSALPQGLTISGVGSWVAFPFIAKDNYKINRLVFTFGTITGSGASSIVRVGIGTLNSETGLPLVSANESLSFIGSTTQIAPSGFTSTLQNVGLQEEISLIAGQRYFLGVETISRTSTSSRHDVILYGSANRASKVSNYEISKRIAAGIEYSGFRAQGASFNYGYFDSGTGVSSYYHDYFYQSRQLSTVGIGTTGSEKGFTFFMNSDLNAIEISEVSVMVQNRLTGTSGNGNTWILTLYDSNGTTALIASTWCSFNSYVITSYQSIKWPLNYILENKKLYHFGVAGFGSNNSNLVYVAFPSYFQSNVNQSAGICYTTYYFTKGTISTPPTIDTNLSMPFAFNIIKTYGNRQGGIGRY